jgi:Methyltransferase domain
MCRTRAGSGHPGEREAERLSFADASLDVVLSQLFVGHLRDAEAAVREMAHVARPGTIVAACVWDFAEGMTVLQALWTAAAAVDAAGASRFDQARTHPYSTPAALRLLWEAADSADIHTGELTASSEYEDLEECWRPMLMPDGAPARFLATLGPAARDAVHELLSKASEGPAAPSRARCPCVLRPRSRRGVPARGAMTVDGSPGATEALLTEARLLGRRQERPSRRTSRFRTAMRRGVAGVGRQGSRVS